MAKHFLILAIVLTTVFILETLLRSCEKICSVVSNFSFVKAVRVLFSVSVCSGNCSKGQWSESSSSQDGPSNQALDWINLSAPLRGLVQLSAKLFSDLIKYQ